MGIFDFFRKKESKPEEPVPVNKALKIQKTVVGEPKLNEEEFNDPQFQDEILAVALMAYTRNENMTDVRDELWQHDLTRSQVDQICQKLADFLVAEQELDATASQPQEFVPTEPEPAPTPQKIALELTETELGDHNDSYAGILGYATMQSVAGEKVVNQLINASISQPVIYENSLYEVCEASFADIGGQSTEIRFRTIYVKANEAGEAFVLSAFPYISAGNSIPFSARKVVEWTQTSELEAEVTGSGKDTFGLGFFATDYAINRKIYQSASELNIRISAVALVIDQSDVTTIDGTALHPDFSSYMPNADFETNSHYDFIGKLIKFNRLVLLNGITGYLMSVKLINNEEDEHFFTVDMFVNDENMRIKELQSGMKLTGVIWLQGEIVA